ncbi:hypothetical protein ACMXYW_03625 [Neptuniibacter sp. QD48_55]|uniref:hypothetical protein n=1 Tax=Neptuniibacter sp. QD48_55 TaxID=3398212 RepID=UPI0039F5AB09
MKRNIIIILIAACVGVTWYIANTTERLTPQIKSAAENAILEQPEFPARPVWWHDDSVMAVGIVPGSVNPHHAASKACEIIKAKGVTTAIVEIYDVVKIQKEDDWDQLAADSCQ